MTHTRACHDYGRPAARRPRATAQARHAQWLAEVPARREMHTALCVASASHPRDSFLASMVEAIEVYGALTERQETATVSALARIEARDAERRAERQAEGAGSAHQGAVGERREWQATVKRQINIPTSFGEMTITILVTPDGHNLVVKGKPLYFTGNGTGRVEAGTLIGFKGTVKAHDDRDGVKQTVLNRVANVVGL